MEISILFEKLAKLHKESPLTKEDAWKAYTFNLISGRVKHLDFDIVDDPTVLDRVSQVRGIGTSSVDKIKEYLRTGTCQRLHEFEKDPLRIAVKTMMNIWGAGPVKVRQDVAELCSTCIFFSHFIPSYCNDTRKACELVNAGYRTISQVREGLASGALNLTANQQIGVKCYEDFMEKMTRKEVEMIADIVIKAVYERFPRAKVTIMGSYRRGKDACGDIDLLITHPDYVETTPRGALGELVDRLRQRGHIAYHLTHLEGMTYEESSQSSLSQAARRRCLPRRSPRATPPRQRTWESFIPPSCPARGAALTSSSIPTESEYLRHCTLPAMVGST